MGAHAGYRYRRSGIVLVAAGLLLNQWTVGYLFSADGTVNDPVFVALIWLVELVLVSVGLSLLIRRKPIDWKRTGFKLCTLALAFLAVEVLLWAITLVAGYVQDDVDPRSLLSPYQGQAWTKGLFDEIHEMTQARRFAYHPFLGWDTKEYHGKYINIGADGNRKTWNPNRPPGTQPPSVYVLGGSTIWGMCERDDYTIPSHLSKMLHGGGYDFVVYNYGAMAYTFTQELVNLIMLLKEGHRPDYVIFYDGVNDVYASYQAGAPGNVLDLFGIRDGFAQRKTPASHFWIGVSGFLAKYSMIYRHTSKITALVSSPPAFPEVGADYSDEQLQLLAEGVAGYYVTSHAVLDCLSQAYGFQYLSFWQPVTLTEDYLHDEEKTDVRVGDTALGKLHRYVREALEAKALPNHYDIADALEGRTTTYYVDYCHLSAEGNAAVAARIYEVLEPRLRQQCATRDAAGAGQTR